jgi:hypothetical protein
LLFDLAADPREAHNLAAERSEVVEKMSTAMLQWKATLPEPLPVKNDSEKN